ARSGRRAFGAAGLGGVHAPRGGVSRLSRCEAVRGAVGCGEHPDRPGVGNDGYGAMPEDDYGVLHLGNRAGGVVPAAWRRESGQSQRLGMGGAAAAALADGKEFGDSGSGSGPAASSVRVVWWRRRTGDFYASAPASRTTG